VGVRGGSFGGVVGLGGGVFTPQKASGAGESIRQEQFLDKPSLSLG